MSDVLFAKYYLKDTVKEVKLGRTCSKDARDAEFGERDRETTLDKHRHKCTNNIKTYHK
jgi:hypothetical protein